MIQEVRKIYNVVRVYNSLGKKPDFNLLLPNIKTQFKN